VLKFPDDTQFAVMGLDDIMAELYAKDRKANDETAEEMIKRLEAKKNFIPSSERVLLCPAEAIQKFHEGSIRKRTVAGWTAI